MVRLSKWSRWSLGVVFPAALLVAQSVPHGPEYTADGRMLPPSGYREWVYLTSGLDMSYTPRGRSMGAAAGAGAMHMFDNVFATPRGVQGFPCDRDLARQDHPRA